MVDSNSGFGMGNERGGMGCRWEPQGWNCGEGKMLPWRLLFLAHFNHQVLIKPSFEGLLIFFPDLSLHGS